MPSNKGAKKPNYDLGDKRHRPLRKRLWRRKREVGTWRALAGELGVNQKYLCDFILDGKEPSNREIMRKIGLRPVCKGCGRPFRSPSVMKKTPVMEPWERWWWSLPREERKRRQRELYEAIH